MHHLNPRDIAICSAKVLADYAWQAFEINGEVAELKNPGSTLPVLGITYIKSFVNIVYAILFAPSNTFIHT